MLNGVANFTAFLKELNVPTIPTSMSLSASEDDGSMGWSSTSLWSFIGSWSRLCQPWFWRLAFDIVRFNFFATDIFAEKSRGILQDERSCSKLPQQPKLESVGEYLERNRYSKQFKRYYLIPMTASPWCMSPADVSRDFPAETLIYFMLVLLSIENILKILIRIPRLRHRFMTFTKNFKWRSFKNGSKTYVDAFLKTIPSGNHHCHLGSEIRCINRQNDGKASVVFMDGSTKEFDHVVLAVHANQALELLGEQSTALEKEILSSFKTSRNEAVLHLDPTVRSIIFLFLLFRINITYDSMSVHNKLLTSSLGNAKIYIDSSVLELCSRESLQDVSFYTVSGKANIDTGERVREANLYTQ